MSRIHTYPNLIYLSKNTVISSQVIAHTSEVTSTYSLHWLRYSRVQEQENEPLELVYFSGASDRRPDLSICTFLS